MADPRVVKGAAVLLFDRLIDFDPGSTTEAHVYRHVTEDGLLGSIKRELERIVATKRAINVADALRETDLTVLQYGVPDSAGLSPHDLPACRMFARALELAFRAFEPRLRNPVARVAAHPDFPTVVSIDVSGSICPGDYVEDVWFPIHISPKASGGAYSRLTR